MSGKNKSTLSANEVIRQIQESFVTRDDEKLEYYTPIPSPGPSPSPRPKKKSKKKQ